MITRNIEKIYLIFICIVFVALFVYASITGDTDTVAYTITECHTENDIEVCTTWIEDRPV